MDPFDYDEFAPAPSISHIKSDFDERVFAPIQQAINLLRSDSVELDQVVVLLAVALYAFRQLRKQATVMEPLFREGRVPVQWPSSPTTPIVDNLTVVMSLQPLINEFPESEIIYINELDLDAGEYYLDIDVTVLAKEILRQKVEDVIKSEYIQRSQEQARQDMLEAGQKLLALVDQHHERGRLKQTQVVSVVRDVFATVALARTILVPSVVTSIAFPSTDGMIKLGENALTKIAQVAGDIMAVSQRRDRPLTEEDFTRISEGLTLIASRISLLPEFGGTGPSSPPQKASAPKRRQPVRSEIIQTASHLLMY